MGGATLVLLKVSLFQLSGHGNPQNDAMFNFISDSSSSILGLSNEVYTIYVVQEVSEKMGKIRKPNIQGDTYFLPPLYLLINSILFYLHSIGLYFTTYFKTKKIK